MKVCPILLVAVVCVLSACVVDKMEKLAPRPTQTMSAKSGVSLTKLEQGRSIFLANCGRCHEHQFPDTVSSSDWHAVVPGMSWNAGLSKNDQQTLLAYLLAAKAK